ncbi:MAG: hypothetical protein IJO54_07045, partial [Oscillospiraceae bacterium]|nr:hypothetical protein [Oscillospiraceae bacterium]
WLAAYRDVRPAAPKHSIWQYSSTGKVKGINGNVDLNHCYKDFETIIKNAGLNGFGKTETEKSETETEKTETEKLKAQLAKTEKQLADAKSRLEQIRKIAGG